MSKSQISFREFPYYGQEFSESETKEWLRQISNLRKGDVDTIALLPSVFLLARKVGKIPTSSADVSASDKLGDINWNVSGGSAYLYILVDNAGTAEWRRVALGSF